MPRASVYAPDGGAHLLALVKERGLTLRSLARMSGLNVGELHRWCVQGGPLPRTQRVIGNLSLALELHPRVLWSYLLGKTPLKRLSAATPAQMRATIPASWIRTLFPLIPVTNRIQQAQINNILRRLRDKILGPKPRRRKGL